MAALHDRATELLSSGETRHRAFRILREEFPHAERDQLLSVVDIGGAPTGRMPLWAELGHPLRPVIIKRPARQRNTGNLGKG